MNEYNTRPDGEYFVDSVQKPIPQQSTWDEMSAVQLLEVKTELQSRAWQFRNTPKIALVLRQSIAKLDGLIAKALHQ